MTLKEWCLRNNPSLLDEWDYNKNDTIHPSNVLPGSDKTAWWKCKFGHEWKTQIKVRTRANCGCPFCSGKRVITGVNDLQTKFPDIAKEWHPDKNGNLLPSEVKSGSQKKVWWICPQKHSYQATIGNRTFLNRGCPFCSGNKTLEGYNDFKTWCRNNDKEYLLDEWDYEKNIVLPSHISPQNNKKVWWKCSLGHEWITQISVRANGGGCPYCSNPPQKILVGFNDFESWCLRNGKEALLKEWNYNRNNGITPKDVTYGSGKRIWWICSKGHEWCVPPSNRSQGTGCPICSRTQTSFPEQAIAYYLSKSFNVLQRYRIKSYEIDVYLEDYSVGIEYDGMLFHTDSSYEREQRKNDFCNKNGITLLRIKESKNRVGIDNNTIYFIPHKTKYIEENFNGVLISLLARLEQLTGVVIDKNVNIIEDELAIRQHYTSYLKNNSLAAVYPNLVSEWDVEKNEGLLPENFSANAHTKVWWKCREGHSWQATISSRNRGLGCPFCAGQRLLIGNNDFETWCKENSSVLLEEWNYERNELSPNEYPKTSNKKVWWKCYLGHEWEASIANRVHGTKCPYCFNGRNPSTGSISLEEWCIKTDNVQLLNEWNYEKNGELTPNSITKGSHKKVWWKCERGHEWEAQIKSRTYNHGCPYCSGTRKKAIVGENDLITWCKEHNKDYIIDEWDYDSNDDLTPEMFTFSSHKRINWKCNKGHQWSAVIKERTKKRGNMCPECRKDNKE